MGILDRIFGRRKKPQIKHRWVYGAEAGARELTPDEVRKYLRESSILQGVYQSILTAGNIFDFSTNNPVSTQIVDGHGGQYLADWMVVGEVRMNNTLAPDPYGDIVVQNNQCPSFSARVLFDTLLLLERAEYEFVSRLGATVFVVPRYDTGSVVVGSAEELEGLRQIFHDKRRAAGVGGIEPILTPIEFVQIPVDADAYDLDGLYRRAIRKVCSLYGIDSTILNDPDNKTYASKEAALKAFYTHTLIPEVHRMLQKINAILALHGVFDQIKVDTSAALPAQDYIAERVGWVAELFDRGIITKDEARKLLDL